ncbi:MAG: Do family serine endopeptidase [Kordiimonas sp.]
MSTYLTKTIDRRDSIGAVKALMVALLITAMTMVSLEPVAARGAPESFADLVEGLQPAVVNISTVQRIERQQRRQRGGRQVPEGLPFGDFFDQFRDRFQEEDDEPRTARSLGSGFIIDASGIVITNNHVIEEADEINVILHDGEEYAATVLGRDELADVAVLQIKHENGDDFPFVKWGDSDAERIGDWVVTIGNPFGLGGSVTAGIISARNRSINRGDVEFIQSDAPINRGNSGGPMFNMEGDVIGVNTAIFSPSGGNVGIGFAIPSNDARRIARELQEHGKVRRGWLGVGIQPLTKEIAETLGIELKKGAMVTRVEPDSPALDGGVEVGDIIFRWDGKEVTDSNSLSRLVKRTEIGQPVDVQVLREGQTVTLQVKTGELVSPDGGNTADEENGDEEDDRGGSELVEGMELSPMTDENRNRYRIADDVEGVVVTRVARRSQAYRAGLLPGAVILQVNQRAVTGPQEVLEITEEAREAGRKSVLVLISLRGNTAHIPLRLLREREDRDEE